ncbi:hypothetical protein AACH06_10515 [Ideonella sp. DXS29W]|uniref:Uncharacterized protein n=1 Tax=Ideonella lacteola TaxID=2984193 RepID=A0ABU9BNB0_9BURK
MIRLATSALAATLCATAITALAADLPLSIAQVEKTTGLSGLSTKPAKYDKAGTNFVTSSGQVALTVKVASAEVYEIWKSHPSMSDQASLAGVGEDAVSSKKGRYVCFKKAGTGVCVVGMADLPGNPAPLSDGQLLELARLAASHL